MTAYTTPTNVATYADTVGATFTADSTERDRAIARATRYLDALPWYGRKTEGREQPNAWPRSNIVDRDGYAVDPLTIPAEIEEAANLIAIAEAANPGALQPKVTMDDRVIQETIGPLSFTYQRSSGPGSAREIVTAAADLLRPFVTSGNLTLTRA